MSYIKTYCKVKVIKIEQDLSGDRNMGQERTEIPEINPYYRTTIHLVKAIDIEILLHILHSYNFKVD